jgi:hypothetical protein
MDEGVELRDLFVFFVVVVNPEYETKWYVN